MSNRPLYNPPLYKDRTDHYLFEQPLALAMGDAYSIVDNYTVLSAYDDSDITNPYSNLYRANQQLLALMYEESDTLDTFDNLINLIEKG